MKIKLRMTTYLNEPIATTKPGCWECVIHGSATKQVRRVACTGCKAVHHICAVCASAQVQSVVESANGNRNMNDMNLRCYSRIGDPCSGFYPKEKVRRILNIKGEQLYDHYMEECWMQKGREAVEQEQKIKALLSKEEEEKYTLEQGFQNIYGIPGQPGKYDGAFMCGRCNYGPFENYMCHLVTSHQGSKLTNSNARNGGNARQTKVDNRCPNCNFLPRLLLARDDPNVKRKTHLEWDGVCRLRLGHVEPSLKNEKPPTSKQKRVYRRLPIDPEERKIEKKRRLKESKKLKNTMEATPAENTISESLVTLPTPLILPSTMTSIVIPVENTSFERLESVPSTLLRVGSLESLTVPNDYADEENELDYDDSSSDDYNSEAEASLDPIYVP